MSFETADKHLDDAYDLINQTRQSIIKARRDLKEAMENQPPPEPIPPIPPPEPPSEPPPPDPEPPPPEPPPPPPEPPPPEPPPPGPGWVQEIIRRHNEGRARYNLPPLRENDKLMRMAQLHSEDQDRMNKLSHIGSDGSQISTRANRVGYRYRWIAENVAWTSGDPLPLWWRSFGHRRNWLSRNAEEIGVGRSGNYWTVVFGRGRR